MTETPSGDASRRRDDADGGPGDPAGGGAGGAADAAGRGGERPGIPAPGRSGAAGTGDGTADASGAVAGAIGRAGRGSGTTGVGADSGTAGTSGADGGAIGHSGNGGRGVLPAGPSPVGTAGHRIDVCERRAWAMSGFVALLLALAAAAYAVWQAVQLAPSVRDAFESEDWAGVPAGRAGLAVAALLVAALLASPLVVIQPGQTRVILFFGRYIGTVRRTGLVWVVPFTSRRHVSVRVNNFETAELKVSDADGNPVNIAAIVVWQVADTARASFAVEDYRDFVEVQSEAALRHVATTHPYDDQSGQGTSLRGSTDVVSDELAHEVAARVDVAGVEILEVRISHLAYAQEIAQAMLQRQQASAIVAARERIVEGAVTMVELALTRLERENVVALDEERKAAMVSNLLVVLCGDQRATPVVNTGSLYT